MVSLSLLTSMKALRSHSCVALSSIHGQKHFYDTIKLFCCQYFIRLSSPTAWLYFTDLLALYFRATGLFLSVYALQREIGKTLIGESEYSIDDLTSAIRAVKEKIADDEGELKKLTDEEAVKKSVYGFYHTRAQAHKKLGRRI